MYSQTVVRYTLQAMRYGCDKAMQRFPRLLQLVEACPDTMQMMIKEVRPGKGAQKGQKASSLRYST